MDATWPRPGITVGSTRSGFVDGLLNQGTQTVLRMMDLKMNRAERVHGLFRACRWAHLSHVLVQVLQVDRDSVLYTRWICRWTVESV